MTLRPLRRMVPAAALLLAACGNPRDQAARELLRLHEAMQQHRAAHGRYPETIDPARPATPANLPFTPQGKVTVRLRGATGDGYQTTARNRSWSCFMGAGPDGARRPRCAPLSASAGGGDAPAAEDARPSVPGITAADSASAPPTSP